MEPIQLQAQPAYQFQESQSGRKTSSASAAAHGIEYAATASIGYPNDYIAKVRKAIEVEGKLRNLITESSSERRSPGDLDKKTDGFMVQRPKHFTIDNVVEFSATAGFGGK
jgi:hypothetical protein